MIFLSYLLLVSPHLEYCATYGLSDAREILINWRECVDRLALRKKKKKRLRRDLIALFQYIFGDYREDRAKILSDKNGGKKREKRGNSDNLQKMEILTGNKAAVGNITDEVVRHPNSLPQEFVESPSSEIFKICLNTAMSNLI